MYPAFSFDGRTCNGGGLASLTRTVLPVGRCSTGPVIQRIRTWLLGAEKHFWALYVCIWHTGQALSQLQRLCPALPGVCQPPSSVRGTCIVVPHAALLAVPDAPPRFFAHRARSASVPQGALGFGPTGRAQLQSPQTPSLGPEPAAASGTEAHRRQWDWSLPPAVREKGRRNVGNHKERRKPRLCGFPGG